MTTRKNAKVEDIIFGRYTYDQLYDAFTSVQNKGNWKLGNTVWIAKADYDLIDCATIFFAGSPLETVGIKGPKVQVAFDGYYARVGA
jgi:hypothetical protein